MAVSKKRASKKTAAKTKTPATKKKTPAGGKKAPLKKKTVPKHPAPQTRKSAALTRAQKMQQTAVDALADAKGQDVVTLDVRKRTDVTDYMIVASGTSTRHVASMADKVLEKMKEAGFRSLGSEGKATGEWVLLDFGDVVVHVMHPQTRDFYNLEKLWSVDVADNDNTHHSELEQHIRGRRAGR